MARPARLPQLNADVGEDERAVTGGAQEALLDVVALANIACGAHAGSVATIDATIAQCAARGVRVGAHPSTPDRAGFGRHGIDLPREALCASVREQIALLVERAARAGVQLHHIKPHGALYHAVSDDEALLRAIVAATRDIAGDARWVLRARSRGLAALAADGVTALAEGFVDRRYDASGGLVPRTAPGALLDTPDEAVRQALALASAGDIDTLCVHGDHAHALAIARAVRAALDAAAAIDASDHA